MSLLRKSNVLLWDIIEITSSFVSFSRKALAKYTKKGICYSRTEYSGSEFEKGVPSFASQRLPWTMNWGRISTCSFPHTPPDSTQQALASQIFPNTHLQPQNRMPSIMSKPFNPKRFVRFHNNTKDLNFNHNMSREWRATTSIDVLSFDELRERLNQLIEMHHPETKQSHTLAGTHQLESETKQKWNIQAISIVWNMPPGTKGLQNVRTPLDDDNWKKILEKMAMRDGTDLIRVQYEEKREVKKKIVASETIEEGEIFEGYGVGHTCR
jgi:hypothetical protein